MRELSLEIINNNKDILWHHKKRKSSQTGRHFQTFYEITLILDGKATNITTNTAELIQKNDIILMNKNTLHELISSNDSTSLKYINVAFSENIMQKIQCIFPEFILSQYTILRHLDDGTVNKLVNIYNEINLNDSFVQAQLDIELFLYHMVKEMLYNNLSTLQPYPSWFKKIMIACQNLEKVQNVKDIFEISPYSKQYTIQKFHEYLNMTPSTYLNTLRIDSAINLLINTNLSITHICYKVGFNNVEYFDRIFKKKMQMTPYRYRKIYQKLAKENIE